MSSFCSGSINATMVKMKQKHGNPHVQMKKKKKIQSSNQQLVSLRSMDFQMLLIHLPRIHCARIWPNRQCGCCIVQLALNERTEGTNIHREVKKGTGKSGKLAASVIHNIISHWWCWAKRIQSIKYCGREWFLLTRLDKRVAIRNNYVFIKRS